MELSPSFFLSTFLLINFWQKFWSACIYLMRESINQNKNMPSFSSSMPLQREWVQLNHIFFFFFFFFFFLVTSLAHNNCRSSCGDLRNVEYPFRFREDPFECGLIGKELNCQENKTIVVIDSWGLYVQAISYENHTMHLTYPNFTNISGCLLPIHISLGGADRYRSFQSYYFVGWMNFVSCSRPIGNPRYIPIPCSNQETEEKLYLISDVYYAYELENSCRLVTRPPFSYGYHQKGASGENIQRNLKMGFDLSWFTDYYFLRRIGPWCLCRTSTKMDYLRYIGASLKDNYLETVPSFEDPDGIFGDQDHQRH